MNRVCKKCKEVKDLTNFALAGIINNITYRRHLCIPCYTKSKKPRKEKIRAWYIELKKGLCCKECGNNDFRVLDFDHRDRSLKSFNVGDGLRRGFRKETILNEIAKCDVLCSNCHRIKTYEETIRSVG